MVDCAAASTDPMYMGSRSFRNDLGFAALALRVLVNLSKQLQCLGVAWQGPSLNYPRRNKSIWLLNFHHIQSYLIISHYWGGCVHFLMSPIQSLLLKSHMLYPQNVVSHSSIYDSVVEVPLMKS